MRCAKTNKTPVISFVADEGNFRVTKVPPGPAMVYVAGQAGIEDLRLARGC